MWLMRNRTGSISVARRFSMLLTVNTSLSIRMDTYLDDIGSSSKRLKPIDKSSSSTVLSSQQDTAIRNHRRQQQPVQKERIRATSTDILTNSSLDSHLTKLSGDQLVHPSNRTLSAAKMDNEEGPPPPIATGQVAKQLRQAVVSARQSSKQHTRKTSSSTTSMSGGDGNERVRGLGPKAKEVLAKSAQHMGHLGHAVVDEAAKTHSTSKRSNEEPRFSRPNRDVHEKRPQAHQKSSAEWNRGGGTRPLRKPVSERWKASVWSKAGISTTVLLRDRFTKRTLLFDCGGMGGVSPAQMSEADTVLISHAHADHCGGLFSHARSRFAAQHPAKYLIPKDSLEQMLVAKKAFEEMDGHELKMEFIQVEPGMTVNLGKGLMVECVRTEHRVPSVGFLIFRTEKRVKPEYAALSAEEKAELGKSGVKLSETVKMFEIAYSGDTTAQGLDPRMFQAQLTIIECTFVHDKDARLARETQHVLLSDLEQVIAGTDYNPDCQLVLMHFSARYSASQITAAVRAANLLPKRTACALAAFNFDPGATDEDSGITFS